MVRKSSVEARLTASKPEKIHFFYSFCPIYYFSRLFGFMPFTISCHSNGTVYEPTIRSLDIFWFIISIFLHLLSTFTIFKNAEISLSSDYAEWKILFGADYVILLSGLIFGAVIIVMDMCNRFKLVGILNNIRTFDEEASRSFQNYYLLLVKIFCLYVFQVEAMGIQFDYKKECRRLCQINAIFVIVSLFLITLSHFSYSPLFQFDYLEAKGLVAINIPYFFIATCLENFTTVQISISFASLLRILYIRFAALNKCLRYLTYI